jgi:hypothetical protein
MAGEVVVCSECGHSSDVHGIEGCEANPSYLRPGTMACPCPLHEEDILPMTPEQLAEFDRNRHRGGRDGVPAQRVPDELPGAQRPREPWEYFDD